LHTPFELIQGKSPIAVSLSFEQIKFHTVEEKIKLMIRNQEESLAAHEPAPSCIASRRKDTFTPFIKGQKVWLDSWNLKTTYYKKVSPKQEGSCKIEEVLGPVAY
jgi:hypothetical protein